MMYYPVIRSRNRVKKSIENTRLMIAWMPIAVVALGFMLIPGCSIGISKVRIIIKTNPPTEGVQYSIHSYYVKGKRVKTSDKKGIVKYDAYCIKYDEREVFRIVGAYDAMDDKCRKEWGEPMRVL